MVVEPESPGEVPKTVRPLPNDLDAALRAACTGVLRNNKPSHEYHKGGKAQLDYATIRRGGGPSAAPVPAPRKPDPVFTTLSKSTSNEDGAHHPNRDSTTLNGVVNPEMSHRISHISASMDMYPQLPEDGFQVQAQRSRAQSRADQLMAGLPIKAPDGQKPRTESHHSRSQSTPQGFWTHPAPQVAPKFGSLRRPKPAPRAHSMETTASPLSDPSMQNPWSMSLAKETTGDEPIQSLPAGPEQAMSSTADKKEDVDALDAEWMHDDSERQRLLRQQVFAESALSRHATLIEPRREQIQEAESKITEQEPYMPTPSAKIPVRKPVPTAQAIVSPESSSSLPSPTIASTNGSDSPPEQLAIEAEPPQIPIEQRSDSRNGRGRTRGNGIPTNTSRAVSRARSVTRGVKEYIRNASRNASRSRQPRSKTDESSNYTRSRRPSISNNVRDFFRPGTAAGKQSLDVPRNMANLKSKSHESFVSARSDSSPAKDTPMQLSQRSSRHHKNSSNSTGRNSFEPGDESIAQRSAPGSESKRQIDLNRALPPLPRLDSWHAEPFMTPDSLTQESPRHALDSPKLRPESTLELPRNARDSSLPSPTFSGALKHVSSRDSRSPLPSPKLAGVHDFVALRMGAPVSRQSSKAKVPRERGNPNLTHQSQRPPMPGRVPTDPKDAKNVLPSDYGFPASSSQAKEREIQAARRRSKSVQEVNAPQLSEKLRNASVNSPDGRPIHAVGQAKLINTTPSRGQLDGLASKIGRKLSTKRRNITPSQHPPAPPPHRELPQRKAKTATSTPNGLSRANSTYHAHKRPDMSRKTSNEEYGRMYDGRFHKNDDELMAPPPPVAVGSSKSSPRMNIGNFLPTKFQPQQSQHSQQSQQQQHHHQQQKSQQDSGSKKWWHLGLGNAGDNMDSVPRNGSVMDQTNGGLGVRY
jgi:hypothetical protein